MIDSISYRKGYKYQLAKDFVIHTGIKDHPFFIEYIGLCRDGLLLIKTGYAWDGCSGPTRDDKTNMRGGLVHDALYQAIRLGYLPGYHRKTADSLLKRICIEDGMWRIRAWWYFEGVDHFAKHAARLGADPYPILTAP